MERSGAVAANHRICPQTRGEGRPPGRDRQGPHLGLSQEMHHALGTAAAPRGRPAWDGGGCTPLRGEPAGGPGHDGRVAQMGTGSPASCPTRGGGSQGAGAGVGQGWAGGLGIKPLVRFVGRGWRTPEEHGWHPQGPLQRPRWFSPRRSQDQAVAPGWAPGSPCRPLVAALEACGPSCQGPFFQNVHPRSWQSKAEAAARCWAQAEQRAKTRQPSQITTQERKALAPPATPLGRPAVPALQRSLPKPACISRRSLTRPAPRSGGAGVPTPSALVPQGPRWQCWWHQSGSVLAQGCVSSVPFRSPGYLPARYRLPECFGNGSSLQI